MRDRAIAWGGGLALLFLHFDFWRPQRAELWFGVVPEELGWRMLWMVLAGIYLAWFCARFFRDEAERDEVEGE